MSKDNIEYPIKVYIISNIDPKRNMPDYIERTCSKLDKRFQIFKPHSLQISNNHSDLAFNAFNSCKKEIDKAKISLILLPLIGRDCASEIGYSKGIGNCNIAYIKNIKTKEEKEHFNDWMVKGWIDYYITPDKKTYNMLLKDHLIKTKMENSKVPPVYLIKDSISDHIENIFKRKIYQLGVI